MPSTSRPPSEPRTLRTAGRYFWRALFWRCPECGGSPIFPPLRRTRSLHDWFTPLDGCPRCGYPYEREIGYFLMAIWAVTYGVGSLAALAVYLYLEYLRSSSLLVLFVGPITVALVVTFFFARHGKAFWLAIDHFCDPHLRPSEPVGDGE